MPARTRITTIQVVAEKNRRSASELARIAFSRRHGRAARAAMTMVRRAIAGLARIGRGQQIAEAAHGLDHVDAELLADAADEYLDGVAVAVEVLVVEMLHQFGARHDAPGVMHQVGEQPVFVAGQLDRIAVDTDAPGT